MNYLGLTIQCQIVIENLQCVLLLPQKYKYSIEGLAGNYNGIYQDDLYDISRNQSVVIGSGTNTTYILNDTAVLDACRSCKFL